jgi:hypothetical protein
MEKLLALKDKNKILYYVLFPLVIIALIIKFVLDNNESKAREEIKDAQKVDFDLEAEQDEAKRIADELKADAAGHGAKAEEHENNANNADADSDWHLKE